MDILERVCRLLEQLPGVGPRTAQRYLFYLLKQPTSRLVELAGALETLAHQITACQRCFNFSTTSVCSLCSSLYRDESLLCVVAKPQDIESIEKSGEFQGLYFVLGGLINPLSGIEPEHLRFDALLERIQKNKVPVKEIILAMNPTLEGERTILHTKKVFQPFHLKLTLLARGLPSGADLEYADEMTLAEALKRRQEIV